MGYLSEMSRCPWTSRTATFITSHFYLEAHSFKGDSLGHGRGLSQMRQGGGNRFGEDDLAGDSEADALTNNGCRSSRSQLPRTQLSASA